MNGRALIAPRTLIADDQPDVLEALSLLLKREGHQTRTAASPLAVINAIRSQDFDLLLMDLNYARDTTSGLEGLDLLARIRDLDSTLPVVVMTAWGSVELAVEAMHRGVGDFVQKPWDNARLLSILRSQVERGRASRRTRRLRASLTWLEQRIPLAGGTQSLIEMVEEQVREALECQDVRDVRDLRIEGSDDEERAYLAEVAAQLGLGLSELQHRENEREIAAACEIQRGFLPRAIPQLVGFTMAGHWQPARVVSGDYYDVLRFDDDHAALCIADVVGKGMPAALLMSNLQAAVKACASATTPPRDLCARVNRIICGNIAPDRFISLFYGLLDAATRRFVYAGAGHNAPILVHRDGSYQRLTSHGRVLGVSADWHCRQAEVVLAPGDRLVLFTDGVTEARGDDDEEFGEQRLIALVTRSRHRAPEEIQDEIVRALAEFCPGGIQDDATLLTVAVHDDTAGS